MADNSVLGHPQEVLVSQQLKAQGALDAKAVYATLVDRNNIPLIERYYGMKVFVEEDGNEYQLRTSVNLNTWTRVDDRAAGNDEEIQFNDNGKLGAIPSLFYDGISLNAGTNGGRRGQLLTTGFFSRNSSDIIVSRLTDNLGGQLILADSTGTTVIFVNANTGALGENYINTKLAINAGITPTGDSDLEVGGIQGIKIPVGTTAERNPVLSQLRFNSDLNVPEIYNGTTWLDLAGGGTGGIGEAPIDGSPYSRQDAGWVAVAGGSTPPAGANQEIQFNNSGVFGSNSGFRFESFGATANIIWLDRPGSLSTFLYADSSGGRIGFYDSVGSAVIGSLGTQGNINNMRLLLGDNSNDIKIYLDSNPSNESYIDTGKSLGIGTRTPNTETIADIGGTSSIKIPNGTTAERPSTPVASMLRFNSSLTTFEGYDGTGWLDLAGGGGGTPAGADTQIQFNNAGAFGASSNLSFDGATLYIGQSIGTHIRLGASTGINLRGVGGNIFGRWNNGVLQIDGGSTFEESLFTGTINSHSWIAKTGTVGVGVGSETPISGVSLIVGGTSSIKIPNGTTAERPSTPAASMLRFNSDLTTFEGYDGTGWLDLADGSTLPAGADTEIQFNNAGVFGASSNFTWDGVSLAINNATPNPKAVFDLFSTTQGFLLPRLTTAEIDSVGAVFGTDNGLMVFNSTIRVPQVWDGLAWRNISTELDGSYYTGSINENSTNFTDEFDIPFKEANVSVRVEVDYSAYSASGVGASSGKVIADYIWDGANLTMFGSEVIVYENNNSGGTIVINLPAIGGATINMNITSSVGARKILNAKWIISKAS